MRYCVQRARERRFARAVLGPVGLVTTMVCHVGCGEDVTSIGVSAKSPHESIVGSEARLGLENIPWEVAADFRIERVAQRLDEPTCLAGVAEPGPNADDPVFYVTERAGNIKTISRSGAVSIFASDLLDFEPAPLDLGLSAAAVDPVSGDVYAALQSSSGGDESPRSVAIERLTSSDGGLSMAGRSRVFSSGPLAGEPLQIESLSFGPDGYLYVSVSSGSNGAGARLLNDFRGKILRMTRTGSAVDRNPYYDAANGITPRDYVFALGLSQPRAGAWRSSDGAQYFIDVGPNVDRLARLVVGEDYAFDGTDRSMSSGAIYNWIPGALPTGIAFIQASAFDGSGFPAAYSERAYVTQAGELDAGPGDREGKVLTEWQIDDDGNLVDGARAIAVYAGDGVVTAGPVAAGPDGLYFAELNAGAPAADSAALGSNLYRLSHTEPAEPIDCNANGIPDADDLSLDNDCNHNGSPDECDVAALTSADCNSNGLPDECESATLRSYPFTYGPYGFGLAGSAEWVDGAVRLTPASGGVGTAIHELVNSDPVSEVRAQFDFRIGGGSGADGMSFVLFDAARYPDDVLFGEEGLGDGALVLSLNTYDNGDGANNIRVLSNGQLLGAYSPTFSLRDGRAHTVDLFVKNGRLTVLVTAAPGVIETAFERLPLPESALRFAARVGFGARTGGLTDEHSIDNVKLWTAGSADANFSGRPDVCECVADVDDGQGLGIPDGEVNTEDLIYVFDAYLGGDAALDLDDGSGRGEPDGSVDEHDLEFFLEHLYAGC